MATFTENNKIVPGIAPIDLNGGVRSGDWVNMAHYNRLTIIFMGGALTGAPTLTIKKGTSVAGAGSVAMAFNYKTCTNPASSDSLSATFTAATSSGVKFSASSTNPLIVVEIEASELATTATAYDCVAAVVPDPSNAALGAVLYILSEPRIGRDVPPAAVS